MKHLNVQLITNNFDQTISENVYSNKINIFVTKLFTLY